VAAHPNTTYTLVNYNDIELPKNVDVVFNVLYYHDLSLNDIDVAKLNKRIYDALKPGGVFLLVDHNARPGSGREDTKALHRIDPAVIKQEVTAAGFVLEEESDMLANPEDDHTKMIYRMPERGTTDRAVFKFRKPN
jgi:predicted methyltransferase